MPLASPPTWVCFNWTQNLRFRTHSSPTLQGSFSSFWQWYALATTMVLTASLYKRPFPNSENFTIPPCTSYFFSLLQECCLVFFIISCPDNALVYSILGTLLLRLLPSIFTFVSFVNLSLKCGTSYFEPLIFFSSLLFMILCLHFHVQILFALQNYCTFQCYALIVRHLSYYYFPGVTFLDWNLTFFSLSVKVIITLFSFCFFLFIHWLSSPLICLFMLIWFASFPTILPLSLRPKFQNWGVSGSFS